MVCHVRRMLTNAIVRKIDCLEVIGTSRGKERSKEALVEIIRNDLTTLNLIDIVVLDQT